MFDLVGCAEEGCPAGRGEVVAGVEAGAAGEQHLHHVPAAAPGRPLQGGLPPAVGGIRVRSSRQQPLGSLWQHRSP